MDIGVWMPAEILDDKLQARQQANTEQAWNLSRWPTGFTEEGENRLFVAVNGAWRGYFTLSRDALYNPNDPSVPFGLLFDTRTWTPIEPVPVKRFRGFTYKVPRADFYRYPIAPRHSVAPITTRARSPSHAIGDHRH